MHFDTPTLMMVGGITTALSGLLLFTVWLQLRQATALLWWIAANLLVAVGIGLLTAGLTGGITPLTIAGSLVSDAALPLYWLGARTFNRRRMPLPTALAIVAAWLAIDGAAGAMLNGPAFGFAGWVAWLSATAVEMWRGRSERLPARQLLIALLSVHAFVYAGGVYDMLNGHLTLNAIAPLHSWFGAIFFEGIAFAMGSAIVMAMLYKERETQEFMRAARSDSLTDIANHGALLENARRLFARCRKDEMPFSLIMFDLDHFKKINDRFGHRAGDAVLRAFTDTVRHLLRPTDFFGRYGGEEFTVILPGATVETAQVIAERVRHAFADAYRFLDGQPLNATVSAGVAEAGADMAFEDTIDAADRAMYRAKDLGRNRVERADRPATDGRETIARIA